MMALTALLFIVLEETAAICTAVVVIIGLGLAVGSIFFYFLKFR